MRERGVNPYPGSVLFVRAARRAGLRTAVVSASANARDVLEAARISALFDVVVNGSVAKRERLRGKPAPDSYLAAARELGIEREHATVFEDALAGVESGRAGGFGYVVGVDRDHQMTRSSITEPTSSCAISQSSLPRSDPACRPRAQAALVDATLIP